MRRSILCATGLLLWGQVLWSQVAFAATANGNGALSLAALVGERSPSLTQAEKILLRAYLYSALTARLPAGEPFAVKADAVTCRISNVDITLKECNLTFGAQTLSLKGRGAHELYATLIEAGVPSSGAAGSIRESVNSLDCVIDPAEVRQQSGGGAKCAFEVNP